MHPTSGLEARDRVIVALDYPSAAEARELIRRLGDTISTYKVGKQLFVAEGPEFVRELVRGGKHVFLDLKFHDIPNTVAGAVRSASALGVKMLTVHAGGGSKMMRAAVEAAAQSAGHPMIVAVTVLTSMAESDLEETGVSGRPLDQVLRLSALARAAGCPGLVASAQEAGKLRQTFGDEVSLVVPGVRPKGIPQQDQSRVATPAEAIEAGTTYLVVGRPITGAADPAKAAQQIVDEVRGVRGKAQSASAV